MLTPDAVLRGEGVDQVLERVSGRVKPPLGVKNEFPTGPPTRDASDAASNGGRVRRTRTRAGA
jgi:hypothetical protein